MKIIKSSLSLFAALFAGNSNLSNCCTFPVKFSTHFGQTHTKALVNGRAEFEKIKKYNEKNNPYMKKFQNINTKVKIDDLKFITEYVILNINFKASYILTRLHVFFDTINYESNNYIFNFPYSACVSYSKNETLPKLPDQEICGDKFLNLYGDKQKSSTKNVVKTDTNKPNITDQEKRSKIFNSMDKITQNFEKNVSSILTEIKTQIVYKNDYSYDFEFNGNTMHLANILGSFRKILGNIEEISKNIINIYPKLIHVFPMATMSELGLELFQTLKNMEKPFKKIFINTEYPENTIAISNYCRKTLPSSFIERNIVHPDTYKKYAYNLSTKTTSSTQTPYKER